MSHKQFISHQVPRDSVSWDDVNGATDGAVATVCCEDHDWGDSRLKGTMQVSETLWSTLKLFSLFQFFICNDPSKCIDCERTIWSLPAMPLRIVGWRNWLEYFSVNAYFYTNSKKLDGIGILKLLATLNLDVIHILKPRRLVHCRLCQNSSFSSHYWFVFTIGMSTWMSSMWTSSMKRTPGTSSAMPSSMYLLTTCKSILQSFCFLFYNEI